MYSLLDEEFNRNKSTQHVNETKHHKPKRIVGLFAHECSITSWLVQRYTRKSSRVLCHILLTRETNKSFDFEQTKQSVSQKSNYRLHLKQNQRTSVAHESETSFWSFVRGEEKSR